jgi:sugar/nucleoside kinase (ribokinase family)
MENKKVIVLGDANVDMVIALPNNTDPNPNLEESAPKLYGGGAGANTAVALARLGANVSMMGAVGDDGYGRWVLEDLSKEGVDIQGVQLTKDYFTSMVMALIEPNGERLIVVWPPEGGADLQFKMGANQENQIKAADWLHVSGINLRPSPAQVEILRGMEIAKKAGLTISYDLNLRIENWGLDNNKRTAVERAIELSDIVLGNAEEEMMPLTNESTAELAAQKICDKQRIVIARQGEAGATVTNPNEIFQSPAFPMQVVDTLGAGDAFNGGFIAGHLAGLNLRKSVIWGNAVAALKIGKSGARGLPNMREMKNLIEG